MNIQYNPSIGIYGMDFYVILGRKGQRVSKRKHCKQRVGKGQRISKDEAIEWFKNKYDGIVRATAPAS